MRTAAIALALTTAAAALGCEESPPPDTRPVDPEPQMSEFVGAEPSPELEEAEDVATGDLVEEHLLGPDDIGAERMLTGTVVARAVEDGFFLRTEDRRVVFVATDRAVTEGTLVRVQGEVVAVEGDEVDTWWSETEGSAEETAGHVEGVAYIVANSVRPVDREEKPGV